MYPHLYVARKERRLKQSDMADLLKVSPITYHRKENGITEFTLPEAFKLARHFGVTVDRLFGGR